LLESSAVALGLNGAELATIVSADLIVVLATGIMNFFLFRHLTGNDSRFPKADLQLYYGLYDVNPHVKTLQIRVSNEDGEDAARDCSALALFRDMEQRDIVDDPNVTTVYNSRNFKSTLRIPLLWSNDRDRCTIVSGDDGYDNPLNVLRVVQAEGSVPAHFEIPCASMRGSRTAVCLNLKHYYGIVRIHPVSGKFKQFPFVIAHDAEGWYFECGRYDDLMWRFLT